MRADQKTARGAALALDGGESVRSTWLPYGRQHISEEDIAAVVSVLRSDYLTQGPQIERFEDKMAQQVGVDHAVAFNSGTAALHAAYFAAGLKEGDELITSAMSFAATANAAVYLGAQPLFADIDLNTGNLTAGSVKNVLTKKSKILVGVDYAGLPCPADELKAVAKEHGLCFIIDAAHSLGAQYKGQPAGSLADISIFSFHPVKTITTGEGGMAVTNDPELARKMRLFRSHGIEKQRLPENSPAWYHEMQELGYNYRLTDIQAALGVSQLDCLPNFIERRRQIAKIYRQKLAGSGEFSCLTEPADSLSAHHLFPVLVNGGAQVREFVFKALHKENIGVQVHYIPTYHHPYYRQRFGDVWQAKCPNTEEFYSKEISLPIFPAMSDADIEDVLSALDKVSRAIQSGNWNK